MHIPNPLTYPLPVLAGCVVILSGARVLQLPPPVVLPLAACVTLVGATFRHQQETDPQQVAIKQVEAELTGVRTLAIELAQQAEVLRQEADRILRNRDVSLDLLTALQYGCDLAIALPQRVQNLVHKLPDARSLLSAEALEARLLKVREQEAHSEGAAQVSLRQLAESLERNIELTKTATNVREAQILNLMRLMQDSGGALQRLQNHLRSINLEDATQVEQLQSLSETLSCLQQEVDMLM